jgi:hypothetical protein
MENDEMKRVLAELSFLREWVAANTRRLDDLESSAFMLDEAEEVVLVTIPKKGDNHTQRVIK